MGIVNNWRRRYHADLNDPRVQDAAVTRGIKFGAPETWEFEHRVAEFATGGISLLPWKARTFGPDAAIVWANRPVPRGAGAHFYRDQSTDAGAVVFY